MKYTIAALLLPLLLFQGCATSRIESKPLGTASLGNGVVYWLPMSLVRVKVEYVAYQYQTVDADGKNVEPGETFLKVEKPPVVDTISCGDPRFAYVMDAERLADSGLLESDLNLTLTQLGNMKSLNADIKDKSIDTAKSLVGAGISVAKLVSVGGLTEAARTRQIVRLGSVTLERTFDPDVAEIVNPAELDGDDALKILANATVRKLTYDPGSLIVSASADASGKITMEPSAAPAPQIDIFIVSPNKAETCSAGPPADAPMGGVVYRLPMSSVVLARVSASDEETWDATYQTVCLPQYGPVGVLPFASKRWTDRATSATFGTDGITLSEFKVKSASSSDRAAAALKDSLAEIVKAQTDILDYQKSVYEKKAEVDKAKATLEGPGQFEETVKALEDDVARVERLKKALQALGVLAGTTPPAAK